MSTKVQERAKQQLRLRNMNKVSDGFYSVPPAKLHAAEVVVVKTKSHLAEAVVFAAFALFLVLGIPALLSVGS